MQTARPRRSPPIQTDRLCESPEEKEGGHAVCERKSPQRVLACSERSYENLFDQQESDRRDLGIVEGLPKRGDRKVQDVSPRPRPRRSRADWFRQVLPNAQQYTAAISRLVTRSCGDVTKELGKAKRRVVESRRCVVAGILRARACARVASPPPAMIQQRGHPGAEQEQRRRLGDCGRLRDEEPLEIVVRAADVRVNQAITSEG